MRSSTVRIVLAMAGLVLFFSLVAAYWLAGFAPGAPDPVAEMAPVVELRGDGARQADHTVLLDLAFEGAGSDERRRVTVQLRPDADLEALLTRTGLVPVQFVKPRRWVVVDISREEAADLLREADVSWLAAGQPAGALPSPDVNR